MGTVVTGSSQLPQPVNYVLMKGLLQAARKKLPYFNGTLPGELIKNGGSAAVKWERINNLAAVTTALGEVTGNSAFLFGRALVTPTYSSVTATAAKYGNAIQVTEEVDLLNVNTRTLKLMDTLGANAGESLNTILKTEYDNATNIRAANGAVGGATASKSYVISKMILGDIQFAVNKINLNAGMPFTPMATGSRDIGTTPIRASYYGTCHVDVEEDLRGLTGFSPVEVYGGYTETMPFEFGAVGGVRWCSTQVSTINLSAGKKTAASGYRGSSTILNDVYTSYIYGREAIGTVGLGAMHAANSYEMYNPKTPPAVEAIFKPVGSAGAGDPFNEIASLAWKAWFVGKILNQGWIVKVYSLASKL